MKHKGNKGFTIVEILVVVVIIGILAALVIIGYNGVQQRAQNALRFSEAKEWEKIVRSYLLQHGTSLLAPYNSSYYCLGTGFTDYSGDGIGDCWDANTNNASTRSESAGLNTEWQKVADKLPNSTRVPISGNPQTSYLRLGPVFGYLGSEVYFVQYWLESNSCPYGSQIWSDSKTVSCRISISV